MSGLACLELSGATGLLVLLGLSFLAAWDDGSVSVVLLGLSFLAACDDGSVSVVSVSFTDFGDRAGLHEGDLDEAEEQDESDEDEVDGDLFRRLRLRRRL